MMHSPPARDGIPPLHSDGETLPEKTSFPRVVRDVPDTPAEFGDKLLALSSPGSQCFEGQWHKSVRDGDFRVLGGFRHFRFCCS